MLLHDAGSHTVLELLKSGYRATVIDNFDNAFEACYERMKKLAGDKADKIKLIKVSIASVMREHMCAAPSPAWYAAAMMLSYGHTDLLDVSAQGDLRNFDDIDKALGTDKSVAINVSHSPLFLEVVVRETYMTPAVTHLLQWACRFDAVIHFAGRKAVGESVQSPMLYYTHNLVGAVNLIEACRKHNLKNVRLSRHMHCASPSDVRTWRPPCGRLPFCHHGS